MSASPLQLAATINRQDPIVRAMLTEIERQEDQIVAAESDAESAWEIIKAQERRVDRKDALLTSLYVLASRGQNNTIDGDAWPNAAHDYWRRAVEVATDLMKQEDAVPS